MLLEDGNVEQLDKEESYAGAEGGDEDGDEAGVEGDVVRDLALETHLPLHSVYRLCVVGDSDLTTRFPHQVLHLHPELRSLDHVTEEDDAVDGQDADDADVGVVAGELVRALDNEMFG